MQPVAHLASPRPGTSRNRPELLPLPARRDTGLFALDSPEPYL